MSTRSWIGMELQNGEIQYIYCHNDGDPNYNGILLLKHYSSLAKMAKLVKQGWASVLRKHVGRKHDFDDPYKPKYRGRFKDIPAEKNGWTTFYIRDRDEDKIDCSSRINTFRQLINSCFESDAEFIYILTLSRGWVWFPNDKNLPMSLDECRPMTINSFIEWTRTSGHWIPECVEGKVKDLEGERESIEGVKV